MKSVKLVVIDGDDTLWADRVHFRRLYKATRDIIESPTAVREAIAESGPGEDGFIESIRKLAERSGLDHLRQAQLHQAIEEFKAHPVTVFPGVEPVLVRLVQGGKELALYSKGIYTEQIGKFERSNLRRLFSRVFIVTEKSASILGEILAQCECRASHVLIIGNSIKDDIAPACAIGTQCLWLNHPENAYGRDGEAIQGVVESSSWNDLAKLTSEASGLKPTRG